MVRAPWASGSVWQRLDVWMSGRLARLVNVWPTSGRSLDHVWPGLKAAQAVFLGSEDAFMYKA
eukprot:664944-Prymnesium_polylepis.1